MATNDKKSLKGESPPPSICSFPVAIIEVMKTEVRESLKDCAFVMQSCDLRDNRRCKACGQPVFLGQLCWYCNEMKEEIRCWPK